MEKHVAADADAATNGYLARLGLATQELVRELGIEDRKIHSSSEVDVWFLTFLRLTSSFGVFRLGPITIHLPAVEEAVCNSVETSSAEPDPSGFNHLSELIRSEWMRSGRRAIDELHVLLAFMRLGEGVPGRVFGELGISPGQGEDYASGKEISKSPESTNRLYTPDEAAVYLRVSVQTVREWIRLGRLKASRLAGQRVLRIKEADLFAVLEPVERTDVDGD